MCRVMCSVLLELICMYFKGHKICLIPYVYFKLDLENVMIHQFVGIYDIGYDSYSDVL